VSQSKHPPVLLLLLLHFHHCLLLLPSLPEHHSHQQQCPQSRFLQQLLLPHLHGQCLLLLLLASLSQR
jgi:hypothetical protein